MKKLSILVMGMFLCFLFGVNAEAESVEESIVHNAPEQIDFSDSLIASKARNGESSFHIDGEKWDEIVKESYREKYPEYKGDVRIFDIETGEDVSFEDSFNASDVAPPEILPRSFAGVPTTGNPNSSIGKIKLYWFLINGDVAHGSGTVFKVSNNIFGTAGHVIYNRQPGHGWAAQGSVLFGCTRSAQGGINTKALYNITSMVTNAGWTDNYNIEDAWGSDFGHVKGNLVMGTAPANLALHTGTVPQSLSGSSYGYNGGPNDVTFSKMVGTMNTSKAWYGNMYESTYNIMPMRGGMSGGPVFDSANRIVGINSNTAGPAGGTPVVSRFVKMRPTIVNSFK